MPYSMPMGSMSSASRSGARRGRGLALLLGLWGAPLGPGIFAVLGAGVAVAGCCAGPEATEQTYQKNLANFDRELARAPASLQPEMKALRADFERQRASLKVPSKEFTMLSTDLSTKRAFYSGKVTMALRDIVLAEVKRQDWVGEFRSRKGKVEEKVVVTPEGQLNAWLYRRLGTKDTTRPEGGTIVGLQAQGLVYRPVGLDSSDEVFAFESPPRRGPDGLSFKRDGRVYLAR